MVERDARRGERGRRAGGVEATQAIAKGLELEARHVEVLVL
jgi:hypothetical protein